MKRRITDEPSYDITDFKELGYGTHQLASLIESVYVILNHDDLGIRLSFAKTG